MDKTRNNHEDISPVGPTYSRTVRAGSTLYISGVTAWHSEADGGPPMDQLRVVLERITRIVAAEGGRPSDIVSLTTHVTTMTDFWPVEGRQRAIYEEYFSGEFPTATYVEVAALAEPGMNVELTAIAVLD